MERHCHISRTRHESGSGTYFSDSYGHVARRMPSRERIYLGRASGLPKTEVTLLPEEAKSSRSIKRMVLPICQLYLE
jgi:hypothetical protein